MASCNCDKTTCDNNKKNYNIAIFTWVSKVIHICFELVLIATLAASLEKLVTLS